MLETRAWLMEMLNISLPESMKAFVDSQVTEGGYRTASEFICELIRAAQNQKARATVDALLLEGLNSGEPVEVTPEYWEQKRRRRAEHLDNQSKTDGPLLKQT